MTLDAVANFIKINVVGTYDAAATDITVETGKGATLPTPPFNMVWYNNTNFGDPSDDSFKEIIRVTSILGDVLTVTRGQEGIAASVKNIAGVQYKLLLAFTVKTYNEISTSTTISDSSSATTWPLLTESVTGTLVPKSDVGLTYNAATANLSTTTFTGALAGNATTSTNTTGNAATVTVADAGEDTTTYPLLAIDLTGNMSPRTDVGLSYNGTTNALTATTFVGALTGNASGSAATVTTAAQTNITSLGTLTALTVDNIYINTNDISSTSGNLTLTPVAGSNITLDGTIVIDAGVVTGATSITSTAFVGLPTSIWLGAEAAYLPATNPAVFNEVIGVTTYAGWSYLAFNDTTAQTSMWRVPLPGYNNGNIILTAYSKPQTGPTGTVTLQYNILTIGLATGEEFDQAILTDTGVNISHTITTMELMPNQVDRDFSGASAWANVDLNAYNETTDLTITASVAAQYCTCPVESVPTTVGKRYRLKFDVANIVATWTIKSYDGTQTLGTVTANGTNQIIEWVASTTGGLRIVAVGSTSSGDFDNFSLTSPTMIHIDSATVDPANVATDDLLILGIQRDVASDDLLGDGQLLGILIKYTKA